MRLCLHVQMAPQPPLLVLSSLVLLCTLTSSQALQQHSHSYRSQQQGPRRGQVAAPFIQKRHREPKGELQRGRAKAHLVESPPHSVTGQDQEWPRTGRHTPSKPRARVLRGLRRLDAETEAEPFVGAKALLNASSVWGFSPFDTWDLSRPWYQWFGVTCDSSDPPVMYALTVAFQAFPASSLPRALSELRNLKSLRLIQSNIVGSLPAWLFKLTRLTQLSLIGNHMTGGVPKSIRGLSNLETLDLRENNFTGGLSNDGVWRLSKLRELDLSGNSFRGTLPKAVSRLRDVQFLDLSHNQISGRIPWTLGMCISLTYLDLSYNNFRSPIPPMLGRLPLLQRVSFRKLNLYGPIPRTFGNNSFLTDLDLSYNQLGGTIPSGLGMLGSLNSLNLAQNKLVGSIPAAFGSLTELSGLLLYGNKLTGSLPPALGKAQGLIWLSVQGNAISGGIPDTFSALTNLRRMDLSVNDLSGPVDVLGNWTQLIVCLLDTNKFNGTIPSTVGNLASLRALQLQRNKLTGTIPSEILQMPALQQLALVDNRLTGTIPQGLFGMPQLSRVYLSSNALTGTLPDDLPTVFLRPNTENVDIDLYNNFLTGPVPPLPADGHGTLDLSFNWMTSGVPAGTPCDGYTISAGIRLILNGNCLLEVSCDDQKYPQACEGFCNTTSDLGACGGKGLCALSGPNSLPTCTCAYGWAPPPDNPGTCVLASTIGYTPPPPEPDNFTQGVSFSRAPLQNLNRYSRYLSLIKLPRSTFSAPPDAFTLGTQAETNPLLAWNSTRDQGPCAACWAVAAVDAVSAVLAIANSPSGGQITPLSVKQALACTPDSGGCAGDFPTSALDYAATAQLAAESAFLGPQQCSAQGSLPPQVVMYEAVKGALGLLLTVQVQPALVLLQGSSLAFQQPACGIQDFVLSDPACYTGSLDHTSLVVGYDLTALIPYFVIRNSWGDAWCNGGYMRLKVQTTGDGVCGMLASPAYYPVVAPPQADPCYTSSTLLEGGFALNPCGGGTCIPAPQWGKYSYQCDCSQTPLGGELKNFASVNNSVAITLPGAGLGITQACAPVDACGAADSNPCQVGTCVNDGLGGYSCLCPPGFKPGSYVDGRALCQPSSLRPGLASYTVDPGVGCVAIGALYNIPIPTLVSQNPGLDCSQPTLTPGQVVNVTNVDYSCRIPYSTTALDATCEAVAGRIRGAVSASLLQSINPGVDCSALVPNQLLCLQAGKWEPQAVCSRFAEVSGSDPCGNAINTYFPGEPLSFFAINQLLSCAPRLDPLSQPGRVPPRVSVCVGSGATGAVKCPKGTGTYSLKRGDDCASLANKARQGLQFPNMRALEASNRLLTGFSCAKARVGQIVCVPLKKG